MKQFLLPMFCFIGLFSFGQYADDTATNERIRSLLQKSLHSSLDSTEKAALTGLTYAIQNKGFGYSENNQDNQKALVEIDRAISIWSALRDTLNQANMLKYRGYLLAKLNRFAEGKEDIQKAIRFYTAKEKMWGVAVSQFDLSLLYDLESRTDSTIHFALKALGYWKDQKQSMRIIPIHNHLMHVYGRLKRYDEALELQQHSEDLVKANGGWDEHNWTPLVDFYFLSKLLFEKTRQNEPAQRYRKLYKKKLETLKNQKISYIPADRGFKGFQTH